MQGEDEGRLDAWTPLGDGQYNFVWVNADNALVLKLQKNYDLLYDVDNPDRSVRVQYEPRPHSPR